MKKAFFGGTFDPPHTGHLALAEKVLTAGLADEVIFAPAWIPPHKAGAAASFEDRFAMLKEMTAGHRNMSVSAIESERKGKSFTIDTLRILSEREPETDFLLLIGGDSLLQLHTWHRAGELAAQTHILCCPRPGALPTLEALEKHWDRNIAEKLMSGVLKDFELHEDASTEIRRKLAAGETVPELNQNVWNYIRRRRLYMTEETKIRKPTSKELACFCARVADDRKATDIVVLDMTEYSAVAEYFVICTGTSSPHLRAISERIQRDAREQFELRARLDGTPESNWMIADFGGVMVHIFTPESRDLFQLDRLWGDAPHVDALPEEPKTAKTSRLR